MSKAKTKEDKLIGADYPCPLFSFKTKECCITMDGCRRYNDLQRSPDGNCRIRLDNFNQYLKQQGYTKEDLDEDYEEIIDVKGAKDDLDKIVKKFNMKPFVVGKVAEEIEFV